MRKKTSSKCQVPGPWPSLAQPCGELGPELQDPASDALVRDRDASFGEDQLHVAQTEAEKMIEPHGVADDLGQEATTGTGTEVWRHPASFAQPLHSGYSPPTW